ncbi:hypothetical protein G7046_g6131 [Stylonectria norvegica]|nr:hypothetical protein G7046_g6131 [Stylonectria norvegica]
MANTDTSKGHVRIDHDFVVDRYKYENKIHYQPCIKAAFYFKKLPNVSYEHFFEHWSHVHADLTAGSRRFGLAKCLRYTQHHQFPEMKEGLKRIGMKTMDYDGCSTLWFKTWDNFEEFFTSTDIQVKLTREDCNNFMVLDDPGINVFVGQEVIIFGKGIPGVDDEDGMTEYLKEEQVADPKSA